MLKIVLEDAVKKLSHFLVIMIGGGWDLIMNVSKIAWVGLLKDLVQWVACYRALTLEMKHRSIDKTNMVGKP